MTGLESAQLKVQRAKVHLSALETAAWEYARTRSKIIPNPHGEPTLDLGGEPSTDISILVGEIVYQLRSALDHLTFDLVRLNPSNIALPKTWDKRCEFPLLLTVPTFGNPVVAHSLPVPYKVFEDSLPGISEDAYTFIESLQPYHTGAGLHNVLKPIAQLANIDKHRHLNVTPGRGAIHRAYTLSDGREIVSTRGGFKQGAKIPHESINFAEVVNVNTSVSPYVTFDEPTVGEGTATLEVQHSLEFCIEVVEAAVIPRFSQLLKYP